MKFFKIIFLILFFVNSAFIINSGENKQVFETKDLKLTLTNNWIIKDIPSNYEKKTVGLFGNPKMQNAQILITRYSGILDYSAVRLRMLQDLMASYPVSQVMIKEPSRVKIMGAKKAKYELWQGTLNSGGKNISLVSPVLIVRVKNSWFIIMGFGGTEIMQKFEDDFMNIIETIE